MSNVLWNLHSTDITYLNYLKVKGFPLSKSQSSASHCNTPTKSQLGRWYWEMQHWFFFLKKQKILERGIENVRLEIDYCGGLN